MESSDCKMCYRLKFEADDFIFERSIYDNDHFDGYLLFN